MRENHAGNPYYRYPDFEARFVADHRELRAAFPHAFMVLEKELRNAAVGLEVLARQNAARLGDGGRLKDTMLALARLRSVRPGAKYYMKLQGFSKLRSDLDQALESHGLTSISAERVMGFARNRQLHAIAVRGSAYPRIMAVAAKRGFSAAIANTDLLAALHAQIARNVAEMRRLFERERLRLIMSDGDAMPFQRVMGYAASDLGIPYIVISHGFIQNPHLLTIAPIRADVLITWSEQERHDLIEVLPPKQAEKVHCFGYPRLTASPMRRHGETLLLVWRPISLEPEADRLVHVERLVGLTAQISEAGFSTRVRLHPKDRRDAVLISRLRATEAVLSEGPLEEEFATCRAVVGLASSVLYEALAAGLPSIQIAETDRDFRFPGVPVLSREDPNFAAALRQYADASPQPVRAFDIDAFMRLVDDLMDRVPTAPAA